MSQPHYPQLMDVPSGLATKSQLKALGLSKHGLKAVATVVAFGKTVPLYSIAEAQAAQNQQLV